MGPFSICDSCDSTILATSLTRLDLQGLLSVLSVLLISLVDEVSRGSQAQPLPYFWRCQMKRLIRRMSSSPAKIGIKSYRSALVRVPRGLATKPCGLGVCPLIVSEGRHYANR